MGFLNNLFAKKDKELAKVLANRKKLDNSLNYQFTAGMFQTMVTGNNFNFDQYYNNEKGTRELVYFCLDCINKVKQIKITSNFMEMPVFFEKRNNKNAIILEIPITPFECESNFIAVVKGIDNKISYYTNEYYEDSNSYGLCLLIDGMRLILQEQPQTLENFKDAILGKEQE